jgi:phosphoribosylglycinamide formyltransferase-1
LLPKYGGKGFYGRKVHEAVLEAGETESGCTVHIVDNNYDTGRIIKQEKVSIRRFETVQTLQARVQGVERELYPKVIDHYLLGLFDNIEEMDISGWSGL